MKNKQFSIFNRKHYLKAFDIDLAKEDNELISNDDDLEQMDKLDKEVVQKITQTFGSTFKK